MKVLVTGSRGFIGRAVAAALADQGHAVVRGVSSRHAAGGVGEIVVDFVRDVDPATWLPRLEGVDCVVNTVGVIGGDAARLAAVHVEAPSALFAACAQRGVQVINVSALGADEGARTAFQRTKRAADDRLLASHPFATVVQPSLVFGPGGASARLFAMLAALPVIPLPGRGAPQVQPIHVDDAAAAIASLPGRREHAGRKIALVGPAPLTLRSLLAQLRAALGLSRPRFVVIPAWLVGMAAALRLPLVSRDTLAMLERGNTADPSATHELLGHAPRPVAQFIPAATRGAAAREAKLAWLLPLLRVAIAVVWVTAGVVSAGLYPVADSLALVARMGVTGGLALLLLYAGVAVDLALGIATLAMRRRRRLWLVQMAVIVTYTVMISIWLPEFWLHPYGPLVKNLPMLCAIWLLYELEDR
jgi:uncharacterized protein YbjT (DUF2867 family)